MSDRGDDSRKAGPPRGSGSRGRGPRIRAAGSRGPLAWFSAKRPVLRFAAIFGLVMGAYYALTAVPVFRLKLFPAYLQLNAMASAAILRWLGHDARTSELSVVSSRFSLEIARGCDAIEPSALFVAAILAFPGSLRSKLPAMILGVAALLTLNLVRIISLFYAGLYFPAAFEVLHVDVWQPVFILLVLLLFVLWAVRVTVRARPRADKGFPS